VTGFSDSVIPINSSDAPRREKDSQTLAPARTDLVEATVKATVRVKRQPNGDPDWRRLRRAAVFFVACLAVSIGLFVIGLYH
jgi:hypothetical protein